MRNAIRSLFATATILVAGVLSAPASLAQSTASFNLPAQLLADSLRAVASQTNSNIIFEKRLVAGLSAEALKARISTSEALQQLLDGTGLTYRYLDERTVAIVPLNDSSPAGKAAATPTANGAAQHERADLSGTNMTQAVQLVQLGDAARGAAGGKHDSTASSDSASDEEADEKKVIHVTGSRIRRDPAESSISPVTVFSRADIERSGFVTIADFVSRITQANNDVTSRETSDLPTSGRTTVNLRGLGNNTTLVLRNGRRMPKSGQGFGQDDYNLNGIPLSSVERIEVLTGSASAIYGSDAIGGVINIITRDHYNGLDLSVQYGNTFQSDVSEKTASLTFGTAGQIGANRHYSAVLNLNTNERNELAASDRPYTARADYSDTGGQPVPAADYFSAHSGAGGLYTAFSLFDPTPLPGLAVNAVAIPGGQDGRSLTIADFLASGAPMSASLDAPQYRQLLAPYEERSASASASLELTEQMQVFAEGSYYDYRIEYRGLPPRADIPVPATHPLNPFGVDLEVKKIFYELGPSRGVTENENRQGAVGVRGTLFSDWHYELYGDHANYRGETTNPMPAAVNFYPIQDFTAEGGLEIIPTPGSIAISETDPDLAFNPFGDGRTTQPNDMALLRSLIGVDDYRERSTSQTWAFQADGTVLDLPGGAAQLAFGGEYRREKVDFRQINSTMRYYISLEDGADRDVSAGFLELNIPLIGAHQQIRGAQSLQLSLAGRLDSESLFGDKLTPKAGLMWQPLPSLTLRGSYSRGYKIPNLKQLFEPQQLFISQFFPSPVDPATNEVISRPLLLNFGGNPDLVPEESVYRSAGVVYEPRWLPRFSLSVDYFDIDYTNKVMTLFDPEVVLNYFPQRVQRDPTTNLVTGFDLRTINIATAAARGVDLRIVHRTDVALGGAVESTLNYTYNITNEEQSTPGGLLRENIDTQYYPRVRANANVFWIITGYTLGSTVTYESSTRNDLLAGAFEPRRIRRGIVLDLQGSVEFDALSNATSRWTEGVKLTLGIHNVLDRPPSPIDGAGGYAKIDPRQRRYYLSLRKTF